MFESNYFHLPKAWHHLEASSRSASFHPQSSSNLHFCGGSITSTHESFRFCRASVPLLWEAPSHQESSCSNPDLICTRQRTAGWLSLLPLLAADSRCFWSTWYGLGSTAFCGWRLWVLRLEKVLTQTGILLSCLRRDNLTLLLPPALSTTPAFHDCCSQLWQICFGSYRISVF